MGINFEVPARPDTDDRYAGYGLAGNPFRVDETLATIDIGSDEARFRKIMCALEVERLMDLIAGETYTDEPRKLWLKEDGNVAKRFNNVVSTGVFRAMVSSANPRILPVYIPVPQVLDDFAGGVYNLIIDRMLPRYFKYAAYAFLYQELKRVSGGDPNAGPFNALELMEQMDKTDGLALDEILFGREFALTEAEEYGVLIEEEVEDPMDPEALEAYLNEGDTSEVAEPVQSEAKDLTEQPRNDVDVSGEVASSPVDQAPRNDVSVDPRRAALLAFATRRLNDPAYGFGNTLKLAVQTGLGDSFVKARIILQQANSPKDELLGLIRFIGKYYNGVVVFIDQLDPWVMFTDAEKIKFLSSIHEFDLMSGGRAVLVSVSNPEVFDAFDSRYKKENEIVPLGLDWLSKNVAEIAADPAEQKTLIETFIKKSSGEGMGPFTADGIAAIFSASDGVCGALDTCGDILEFGSGQDFPPIDAGFVKRQA